MKTTIFTLALVLLSFFTQAQTKGDDIVGIWKTGSGKGKVEIYRATDGKYYGKIIWLSEPNNEQGKPKLDKNNPDKNKQTRPVMGLLILREFSFEGDGEYEDGKIYDPENGKDYSCVMELTDKNTLEVRGYVGITLLGRTDTWKREK